MVRLPQFEKPSYGRNMPEGLILEAEKNLSSWDVVQKKHIQNIVRTSVKI